MSNKHLNPFLQGMRDGIPIMLGYFAVSITIGIAARNAGLNASEAGFGSLMLMASAGEFAGFNLIAAGAGLLEVALMELVVNARYLLMSCALSQKLDPKTGLIHRLIMGHSVTDEIFGVSIGSEGFVKPAFFYGLMAVSIPGWTVGTVLGVTLGNLLPLRMVSALSVSLFGMFVAVFIPAARKNKVVGVLVAVSFLLSFICEYLPALSSISSGTRIILLTVVISAAAAILKPVDEEAIK